MHIPGAANGGMLPPGPWHYTGRMGLLTASAVPAIALVLSLAASLARTQEPPSRESRPLPAEGSVTLAASGAETEATYRYRLVEPPAKATENGARVPLIVFLHGAGERGDDNRAQLVHFVSTAATAEFQAKQPCFVLAMQCPKNEWWAAVDLAAVREGGGAPTFRKEPTRSMRAVMQAMDAIIASRPIDPDRVYLTGLSMGGFGSFDLAARRPERFAAVVPICGGGDPSTAATLASIPMYVVHGDDDGIVPVRLSRLMRDAIEAEAKRTGTSLLRYREYPKVGHDSWTPAYRFGDEGVLDWMFGQRRAKR